MIFDGTISSDKTEILIQKYAELLNSGIPASKILVLVQNSTLKNNFLQQTRKNLQTDIVEKLKVYSFFGLVYNTINDNWAYLESINKYENPTLLPNLTGLEVSQYILKNILKEIPFKGYNSKKSLLHQLFRRYALIVQNNLSDDEVDKRSEILKEAFGQDAKITIKKFLIETIKLRNFDYLRQTLIFKHIYEHTNYFSDIEYLILDDGDEITPVCFDFITHLKLKDVFIAFDKLGGSRTGYLSADKNAVWEFEKIFNEKATSLENHSKLQYDAQTLFDNIINNETNKLKHLTLQSPSKREQAIELALKKIKELQSTNVMTKDICVITPVIDDMLKFSLMENISANLKFLSGSEKLIQNKLVQIALTILKLNTALKSTLTEFDIRVILSEILGINIKYCREILNEFDNTQTLLKYDFKDEEFNAKYSKLLALVEKLSTSNLKLSEQVCEIYEELFDIKYINIDELNKFNFFIKQLRDFENVFGQEFNSKKTDIITQIENSIISENPYSSLEIDSNDLIISTPQKIIDNQIRTKYQIWLDVSSNEWIKSDTGPLYNAWVFQKGWNKKTFTIDDNINLSKDKTARILRKLILCTGEKIYAYSSLFDSNGVENFGGIEQYLKFEEENSQPQSIKPIIPRKDQQPVLDYQKGTMAISAVPGAGKTTILLALILKLLDNGIKSENIFVLTYMESAARNFRDRIKNIRQNSSEIPNISTIHGLALRILKENGNFERLGLNSDFEICDDTQRSRILQEISAKIKLKTKKEQEEFDRAISIYKHINGKPTPSNNPKINKFMEFFKCYQEELNRQNLIDYDDMLTFSVRLLQENKDILEYYQNICQYVIEDEAQDSSAIQQKLITLLSGKHKNLIRCGDINQAITTTFSNSDVEGFRQFIKSNHNVEMMCSQRCTKDVWTLANNLVEFASSMPASQNAFFKILMQPVEGKNPVQEHAITSKIFEKPLEEQNYILQTIRNNFARNPKSTVGILLRDNWQVARWCSYISQSGMSAITRSEALGQKVIFKTIFSILKMIINPFDNNILANNCEILAEIGFYKSFVSVEIRKYEVPFIELNFDDIENRELAQFHSDLSYWLSMPHLPIDELATKIGLHYFKSEIEKSNVYLISTLIKRISSANSKPDYIINRLEELSKKSRLSGFNFFAEEDENDKKYFEGKVQVMTFHKSKGDEFDIVFLPEMSEDKLPLEMEDVKVKSFDFNEGIKSSSQEYASKTEDDYKKELLAENLRLLYVAITRAKSKLIITTSKTIKGYGDKLKANEPNIIFEQLLKGYNG